MTGELNDKHMTLHLKREVAGRWVPVLLTIEKSTGRILEERTPHTSAPPPVPADQRPAAMSPNVEEITATARRMGAVVRVDHSGPVPQAVIEYTPVTHMLLDFFQPGKPCFFPGCEELRAEWQAAEAALPPGCPDCEVGKLMGRYMERIQPLIPHAPPTTPHSATEPVR